MRRALQRLRPLLVLPALATLVSCESNEPSSDPHPTLEQVAAGSGSTCVVAEDGLAYCWGQTFDGAEAVDPACGHACRTHPETLAVGLKFRDLRLASNLFGATICGISAEPQAYCWGTLLVGFDGGFSIGTVPQTITAGQPLSSVSVASRHFCGLATTGAAYCWGDYRGGIRGTGVPLADEFVEADLSPNAVAGGLVFTALALGLGNSCGLDPAGQAYCWGSEVALGNPNATLYPEEQCGYTVPPFYARCAHAPMAVAGGHSFTSLAAGQSHVCGLKAEGDVYCWGSNGSGQLGTGDTTYAPIPIRANLPEPARAITAGTEFTCALGTSGQGYCWGLSHVGQAGIGANALAVLEPAPVAGGAHYRLISAGESHVCALRVSGELDCWGSNFRGELGSGDLNSNPVPRQVQF
jgi:alpha-tubulin suppressor-like RCC1 family protein